MHVNRAASKAKGSTICPYDARAIFNVREHAALIVAEIGCILNIDPCLCKMKCNNFHI